MAIPAETTQRLFRVGSAFAVGGAVAATARVNPAAETMVMYGAGFLGLLASLTMRGMLAEVGEGAAAAAAAAIGNKVVTQVWPTTLAARLIASGGGPRINLLPAGRGVGDLIPQGQTARAGGYRPIQ